MATDTQPRVRQPAVRDRKVYRLTADQVFRMIECGILPEGGNIELWDGVLYKKTKGETHNAVVGEIADRLRPLIPPSHHVREEKSNRYGERSLPEPDVTVCPGKRFDYAPNVPPLSRLSLVVEVSQTSSEFDTGPRLSRYAEVGIPVYWIAEIDRRAVSVHTRPVGVGKSALYAHVEIFLPGQSFPVVIDGTEVGRVAVDDLFPPTSNK